MSTHTTYFCDNCNSDRDIDRSDDDGHAINYGEWPLGDGWAEFGKPYTNSLGYEARSESNICAHCLASPEFEPRSYGTIAEWDTDSQENFAKGRAHAEAFEWAREHLGTRDERWGFMRGVSQVFGERSYWYGPRLADGRFSPSDPVREPRKAVA